MRETRQSGSEGGAGFNPLSLPLSGGRRFVRHSMLVCWGGRQKNACSLILVAASFKAKGLSPAFFFNNRCWVAADTSALASTRAKGVWVAP